MAKEVLQKHDHVLSGRTVTAATEAQNHNISSMAYLPIGDACGRALRIEQAALTTTLNLLSSTLFSVDFGNHDSNSTQEYKEAIQGVVDTVRAPNLADFFPILKRIRLNCGHSGQVMTKLLLNPEMMSNAKNELKTALAHQMLHLLVATLIHNFDWKIERIKGKDVNREEKFGLLLRRAVPLRAIPIKI
ncbi:hypothetical protein BUALT_Bualt10G0050900 [Buddleja alternifolia]|uniref:Uncharacterized protein n=1 Tax=Buddleja alternifolia TaxID=168488 RepID=A0AAV6WW68_9LAMI|nr:hypothetical protein BUALT_Bualt10G0050900 [Buddleja alternifolia]